MLDVEEDQRNVRSESLMRAPNSVTLEPLADPARVEARRRVATRRMWRSTNPSPKLTRVKCSHQ